MNNQVDRVRIDKWLWASRFYKTRQLAIKAIKNSQIKLNKQVVKPSAMVKAEDIIDIKRGHNQLQVTVLALQEKRGSATIAQSLYQETAQSILAAKALKDQLANQPKIDIDHRKPDKRDVRSHRAFKRGD